MSKSPFVRLISIVHFESRLFRHINVLEFGIHCVGELHIGIQDVAFLPSCALLLHHMIYKLRLSDMSYFMIRSKKGHALDRVLLLQ